MAGNDKSTVVMMYVFDFETGGLKCQECAATQISIHAVRLDTFEMVDTLNLYISPYQYQESAGKAAKKVLKSKYEDDAAPLMKYEEAALDYSAITMDMLERLGKPLEDVCDQILEFIETNSPKTSPANKPILCGQNVLFDIGFLQQIFVYTKRWEALCKLIRGHKDFWGNFQPYYIDTIILSQLAFNHDRSINTYKLEISAERLGIDLDDAHDADADVLATQEIVRVLTAKMRSDGDGTDAGLAEVKKVKLREHFKI